MSNTQTSARPQRGRPGFIVGEKKGTWTVLSLHRIGHRGERHWLCGCECGRQVVISTSNWRARTRRCECLPKTPNYNQLPAGESAFNVLYAQYAARARRRQLAFIIGRDHFRWLTAQPCIYCGRTPHQKRITSTGGDPYVYTGIDRIDPSRGYEEDNSVPCCGVCNRAKSDMTHEQWKQHIRLLASRIDEW